MSSGGGVLHVRDASYLSRGLISLFDMCNGARQDATTSPMVTVRLQTLGGSAIPVWCHSSIKSESTFTRPQCPTVNAFFQCLLQSYARVICSYKTLRIGDATANAFLEVLLCVLLTYAAFQDALANAIEMICPQNRLQHHPAF